MTLAAVGVASFTLTACASDAEPADAMSGSEDAMESTHDSMESTTEATATADAMEDDAMDKDDDESSDDAMAADVPTELDFTATTLMDGAEFAGADLAGQDTILWAWASWCPICQGEAPDVAAANAALPDGVTLYGLPGQADVDSSQGFVDTYGLGDFQHIFDEDGSLWSGFGVSYQPAFVLINDDGTIETVAGSLDTDEIVAAAEDLASR
ncbi:redoxin domain-containing protein [Demequina sp. B12]|uniref:TlpA family protein disulfide reductase n=1 Tax=Demequina sp. B12 TaxID=2992757 RepID=UPI00237BAEDF|nr:redoxin domain-containing protein [Demequina sp. B12]MDE0572159.1 redoxin domain-containing protein [Demequina sp. B12]